MIGETTATLIAYSRMDNRICPLPPLWNELWEMLPQRRRLGNGWEPPAPLILAAWNYASNLEKMLRVAEHIEWAEQHGCLAEISTFLRGLPESEWHHFGD
jgi:hypothetical protein